MTLSKKQKILITTSLITLTTIAIIINHAANQIIAPTRRPLQTYHQEILNNPTQHSITITKTNALNNQVPTLIIEPIPNSPISKRAQILRNQLQESGTTLPEIGTIQANLVLLHGRKGRKEDLLPIAERFAAAGFRCIIPDLPAHGESPIKFTRYGTTEFEKNLPADLLTEITKTQNLPPLPAALWGMSMGGFFAIHSAAQPNAPWKSLTIVCSFDSLQNVISDNAKRYTGPLSPLLTKTISTLTKSRANLDPITTTPYQKAQKIKIPTLVLHGTADHLITNTRGKNLYNHLASPTKQWIDVTDATHANILITPQPIFAPTATFLRTHTL